MKTKRFLAVLGVALCSMVLGSCGGDPVVPTPDPVDPDPVNPDPVDPDPVDPEWRGPRSRNRRSRPAAP